MFWFKYAAHVFVQWVVKFWWAFKQENKSILRKRERELRVIGVKINYYSGHRPT